VNPSTGLCTTCAAGSLNGNNYGCVSPSGTIAAGQMAPVAAYI